MSLMLANMVQLPVYMLQRPIFHKQRAQRFFRASSYVIAHSTINIPQPFVEASVYSVVCVHDEGIKELVDRGINHVPPKYIHPVTERPCLSQACSDVNVPVVDLAGLLGDGRRQVIEEVGRACQEWGFLQVINHGVPRAVIERVCAAAEKFFGLPADERSRFYPDDPRNQRQMGANWKETIGCESESSTPSFCREPVREYKEELQLLAYRIYRAVIESLGVTPDMEKAKAHVSRLNMLMHYYPPCPDPSLTYGLSEHTDAGFLTILLQDQVGGLEVMKGNQWVSVKPVPDSFTINLADQMEILSNGKYQSVLYRVVTNSEKPRMSIPCLLGPEMDARIAPLLQLIDDNNPPLYKEVVFGDYIRNYLKVRFANTATSGTGFAKVEPVSSQKTVT